MTPESSRAYYRAQRALSVAARVLTRRAWSGMRADYDDSWRTQGPRVELAAKSAQLGAARAATPYLKDVLAELEIPDEPVAEVEPRGFVGVAGDGRPVDSLLYGAVTTAKQATADGASPPQALEQGGRWLDMTLETLLADTGRAAVSAGMAARPAVTGWVRMLDLPSCSRCVVLAGKFFRWNEGFLRHPRCLPAGVVVSGPAVDAATRRAYQGELVVITTASGQQLPITGNHPVLTDCGWIPAHLVEEGSHVVRSTRSQGAGALVIPDEDQVPARVEDLWSPHGVVALRQVPTSPQDFHGDGGHGEVDVVLADRLLRDWSQVAPVQFAHEENLARRVAQTSGLALLGTTEQHVERLLGAADSVVGVRGLLQPLLGGLSAGSDLARLRHVTDLDAPLFEPSAYGVAGDAVPDAEAVLALASGVGRDEGVWQDATAARWDPPAGPFTMESRAAYADLGQDLRLRLASQVALDRVVKVERVEWSGHVYNLTSAEGWYSANGLIVSNCDCRHIPATEHIAGSLTTDPQAAYRSGQVRGLTAAQRKALDDGADFGRVVNSRRGMDSARSETTREATARRRQRLSPEGVYLRAGDNRDEALRLLRLHGYLTT